MNRIRELRLALGYSQKELGNMVDKSLYAVSKWELGEREPSNEDLIKLCDALGTTADYLLGRTDANTRRVELEGAALPKSLRDAGLEKVQLLREYIDENGGLPPEVQKELLRLVAEAKLLQDK
jgi:transcriptional regulator with XRE-family HTH domain